MNHLAYYLELQDDNVDNKLTSEKKLMFSKESTDEMHKYLLFALFVCGLRRCTSFKIDRNQYNL